MLDDCVCTLKNKKPKWKKTFEKQPIAAVMVKQLLHFKNRINTMSDDW